MNNCMANSVDPDETARYEPSHLDLHCLQRYLYWSAGMKGLKSNTYFLFYYTSSTVGANNKYR